MYSIKKYFFGLFLLLLFITCSEKPKERYVPRESFPGAPYLTVLGVAQDAGYPQLACQKDCCKRVWTHPKNKRLISCVAIVDPNIQKAWLIDATPDFVEQWQLLEKQKLKIAGIFLTHAHIGHYTGLMFLGREALGAKEMPIYAMPKMKSFLQNNGPWSQLVELKNIDLKSLQADSTISITSKLQITPFLVPHRDEFSETVGYKITGQSKSIIFIPDINKWEVWERDILEEIKAIDFAFLDGSFYDNGELPNRDMSEIPHPFVEESVQLFDPLSTKDKAKIYFIHFNHTNPLLIDGSAAQKELEELGYHVAEEGQVVIL